MSGWGFQLKATETECGKIKLKGRSLEQYEKEHRIKGKRQKARSQEDSVQDFKCQNGLCWGTVYPECHSLILMGT